MQSAPAVFLENTYFKLHLCDNINDIVIHLQNTDWKYLHTHTHQ